MNSGWPRPYNNVSLFNHKLIDELNRFEKLFGEYILSKTNDASYKTKAYALARLLFRDDDSSVLIDSFNYSDFSKHPDIVI